MFLVCPVEAIYGRVTTNAILTHIKGFIRVGGVLFFFSEAVFLHYDMTITTIVLAFLLGSLVPRPPKNPHLPLHVMLLQFSIPISTNPKTT